MLGDDDVGEWRWANALCRNITRFVLNQWCGGL
jgi:hypothetical protein